MSLTHVDEAGRARMVNVGDKAETHRIAVARAEVHMQPETLALIEANRVAKGDVLAVAQVAGIMAAKETGRLIPMCHPLNLTGVTLRLEPRREAARVDIEATVSTTGRTGVEMEALTAVTVAALTVYDMCKAVDRGMRVENVRLAYKAGGRSGEIILEADARPAEEG
ncbi:MAG: cyclic pyranopterin monophosphate synthase MoaC [Chloroflexi bacterium]|nr:cyclic pyranopterin monophosphate synthase MoaC [Chloroflexota bacterium]